MCKRKSNSPDMVALDSALRQARDLCRRLDLSKEAATFEALMARFKNELPTYESLQDEVHDAINGIPALRILTKLGNDHSEYNRLQEAFGRVLFPEIYKEAQRERLSLEKRIDDHCDKVVTSSTKAEARAWLRQPNHGFFKVNRADVSGFVDEFYRAGAMEVLIGNIEKDQSAQLGQELLVILPKNPSARAKLFKIGARAEEAFQCDHVSEKGQKYLYYSLD